MEPTRRNKGVFIYMFICQVCLKNSQPYEKPTKVVVEKRSKEYRDDWGRIVGTGMETVREVTVCLNCEWEINGHLRPV